MRFFGNISTELYQKNIVDFRIVSALDGTMTGYHIRNIEKGTLGEADKIREETEEFIDAVEQGVALMALVELSDLYGAIEAYLEKNHPSLTITDLREMSAVTKRAFKNGRR